MPVSYHTLDLVELSQMRRVQSLIPKTRLLTSEKVSPSFSFSLPEHLVDTEILLRHEPPLLVGQVVEHPRGHGCGVGPQEVLGRLLLLPVVSVALGPKATTAVNFLNFLQIVFGKVFCCGRI